MTTGEIWYGERSNHTGVKIAGHEQEKKSSFTEAPQEAEEARGEEEGEAVEHVAMKKACLLTGGPGVGKTTLIMRAVQAAGPVAGGFLTEEIRAGGARQGFRIVTLDGRSAILSHVDIRSPHRVGKYGVDIRSLDDVGVAALVSATQDRELVVIDEIGKMELFSASFRDAVSDALDSGKRVLGTVMLASHPWADRIKRHPNVALVSVTRENREQVLEKVIEWLEA